MLGAFRSAHAGPRSAAARVGLAALLACIGLTWTAGATSAFATYGTVSITKKNVGGDAADLFHFDAPSAIKAGGFDLKGGETYTNSHVLYNTSKYAQAYTVSEPASDKYTLKSIDCDVTPAYHNGSAVTSLATRSVAIRSASARRSPARSPTSARPARSPSRSSSSRRRTRASSTSGRQHQGRLRRFGDGGYGSATVPDRHAHRGRVRRQPRRLRPLHEVR